VKSKIKSQRSKTQIKNKKPVVPIDLDKLLAKITKDNLHSSIETGPAVGKEIW